MKTASRYEQEAARRRAAAYLRRLPLSGEVRAALDADVSELPLDRGPGPALEALFQRLGPLEPQGLPPAGPAVARGHMASQYLGWRRLGGPAARRTSWFWYVFLFAALLAFLAVFSIPELF